MTEAISPPTRIFTSRNALSGTTRSGLSFYTCADVSTFSSISFTWRLGAWCDLELQVQTFNRFHDKYPPGGCVSGCYGFPSKAGAIPSSTATTVTTAFSALSVGLRRTPPSRWHPVPVSVPQVADVAPRPRARLTSIDDVKFGPEIPSGLPAGSRLARFQDFTRRSTRAAGLVQSRV